MAAWNHVCEDCGHQWESSKEDQKCPNCGSDSTQSSKQRVGSMIALGAMTMPHNESSVSFFGTKIV